MNQQRNREPKASVAQSLSEVNAYMSELSAEQRVEWAVKHLPGTHVLTSSFGVQSAVSLHMLSRVSSAIPVVLIDTGYLFPETYQFVDQLVERLDLDLRVYSPQITAAWQEARYGQLWLQGETALERYNYLNKVEPMSRALQDMSVGTWFAGLRRDQSDSRADIPYVKYDGERYKVHPIADWSGQDVLDYLEEHALPGHPLLEQGYVSVGDVTTTRKWEPGMREEDTRFFGVKRECGLHTRL